LRWRDEICRATTTSRSAPLTAMLMPAPRGGRSSAMK
jgi:hypothetical protein